MTVNYYAQRVTVPEAFVTKGRQRLKQFHESVYLKNGEEFEIELFNPTTEKVLAKIELNGKSLGSGIILRPGERVFLERYFDEARKFLFETYDVEAGNPNVDQAIALNGFVKVEFYQEYKPVQLSSITWSQTSDWNYNPTVTRNPGVFYTNTSSPGIGQVHSTLTSDAKNFLGLASKNVEAPKYEAYNMSCNAIENFSADIAPAQEFKETGRIEKGSSSDQSFVYDNTTFNSYSTWRTSWRILPDSQKPRESHDLKSFCTKCGAKQKRHTHKYCPICGTKYE